MEKILSTTQLLEKEENLNENRVQRTIIEKQVKTIRIDINQHLDRLEKQILHELSNQEDHHERNIEKLSKQLKVQSSRIELYKTEKEVEVLCEDDSLKRYGITFITDDKLGNFIEDLKTFGEISSTYEQTKIVYKKSKVKQAQIVTVPYKHVESMNLVLEKKIVVSRSCKSTFGLVTGCVVLQNKNFLISCYDYFDSDNNCLSLIDEHGSEIFVLKQDRLRIKPYNIALINDTTVAITPANPSQSIAIFNIETRKVSKVIKTKQLCSGGISCFENTLIYSCGEEGSEMISLDTGNICSLKFGSHASNEYVTVFKNKIYSTDGSVTQ
ncbi:unnamed protein product [Mytilus edulis]|uniref:Uncharacterized protein n=1 Tax=Mytilus edulis TaxID=6550 RepID=A0A8S3PZ29_MYTED|nr:unnamed protein product [Mytilus edulis]